MSKLASACVPLALTMGIVTFSAGLFTGAASVQALEAVCSNNEAKKQKVVVAAKAAGIFTALTIVTGGVFLLGEKLDRLARV
jgi:F0F1-type ATP synthase membrane subunit c/vacuolar-type H+-ATPase subunit K